MVWGVTSLAVPRYLHQGAQGLHVGLFRVQQCHDDVFPHVLPGWKERQDEFWGDTTEGSYVAGVGVGAGAGACRGG